MSKRFFTADWHLNSEGTRTVVHRPFKTVEKMNERIISNANQRAKNRSDIIIHVGDFCQRGDDNHYIDKSARSGSREKPERFIDSIIATFVNVEGNHDRHNDVRSTCRSMMTKIGNFHDASVGHYPSWYDDARGTFVSHHGRKDWTIRICGHVHEKWKHMFDFENMILNINVGVDVWGYQIVSESEILGYVGHIANDIDDTVKREMKKRKRYEKW